MINKDVEDSLQLQVMLPECKPVIKKRLFDDTTFEISVKNPGVGVLINEIINGSSTETVTRFSS